MFVTLGQQGDPLTQFWGTLRVHWVSVDDLPEGYSQAMVGRIAPSSTAQPRFSGLLLKASIAYGNQKPHMTGYFFDTQRICPTLSDGVVIAQPVDRNKPPILLEADNDIVGYTSDSLRRGGHFNQRTVWPWPNDLRMLYDEMIRRLTHDRGWLAAMGAGTRNEQSGFQALYDDQRPRDHRMTLTEIIADTAGFREGWNSGEIESNNRRPLIDDDWRGILGDAAELLGSHYPLPSQPCQPLPVSFTADMLRATQNRKRVDLPEPTLAWLKDPAHADLVNWAMAPDGEQLFKWLRASSHYGLFKRMMRLAQLSSKPGDRPLSEALVTAPHPSGAPTAVDSLATGAAAVPLKTGYLPKPLVEWLGEGGTTGTKNHLSMIQWLMNPKVAERMRWFNAHADWEVPYRMQLCAAIEASHASPSSTSTAVTQGDATGV